MPNKDLYREALAKGLAGELAKFDSAIRDDEAEECAKLAEDFGRVAGAWQDTCPTAKRIAAAIRARIKARQES